MVAHDLARLWLHMKKEKKKMLLCQIVFMMQLRWKSTESPFWASIGLGSVCCSGSLFLLLCLVPVACIGLCCCLLVVTLFSLSLVSLL